MFHPVLAFIDMPIIIVIAGAAALLFGYDKIPKLARSMGAAKKEFMIGQIEADEATTKAREEMRARVAGTTPETPPPSTEEHHQ